jgi:hypothetical protein
MLRAVTDHYVIWVKVPQYVLEDGAIEKPVLGSHFEVGLAIQPSKDCESQAFQRVVGKVRSLIDG